MSTHGVKKNLRGAQTYAPPHSKAFRDNYDRIFGEKKMPGEPCVHDYKAEDGSILTACRHCNRPLTMDSR